MTGALQAARAAEKEQAHFYRSLAAAAEAADRPDLAERFHDLHADEQHHVSRLTARLVELGEQPAALSSAAPAAAELEGWEAVAAARERAEVERYESLLAGEWDEATRGLLIDTLEVERRHAETLGGKWTMA
jgi:rubrerythrin